MTKQVLFYRQGRCNLLSNAEGYSWDYFDNLTFGAMFLGLPEKDQTTCSTVDLPAFGGKIRPNLPIPAESSPKVFNMYRREYRHPLSFEYFLLPFGCKLSGDNRWIKLTELILWDEL